MSVGPLEYTKSIRRQSRPMYEYPAAYNGLRTEGPGWEKYQEYRKNFDKSWEDYRQEDPQGYRDFWDRVETLASSKRR